jgi:uncharacterized phage-associated protein
MPTQHPELDPSASVPSDPRSICNLILDDAGERHITNLALQKLLYFAHGLYLIETKRPLVSGYFEAWQYGPVHPTAYAAFKHAGDRRIDFRAMRRDPLTGESLSIPNPTDSDIIECVKRITVTYARLTPGRLVEIAHAPGAPWAFIVDKARTSVAFGLRIPDNVIVERFNRHKVPIGLMPSMGEPSEDAPFTSD